MILMTIKIRICRITSFSFCFIYMLQINVLWICVNICLLSIIRLLLFPICVCMRCTVTMFISQIITMSVYRKLLHIHMIIMFVLLSILMVCVLWCIICMIRICILNYLICVCSLIIVMLNIYILGISIIFLRCVYWYFAVSYFSQCSCVISF
jgi:hypothetical protein